MGAQRRIRATVKGRVQGVFFRDTTRIKAASVGALGWVRNLPNGDVEVVVEGSNEQVQQMIDFLRVGPSRAVVTELLVEEEVPIDELLDFRVLH